MIQFIGLYCQVAETVDTFPGPMLLQTSAPVHGGRLQIRNIKPIDQAAYLPVRPRRVNEVVDSLLSGSLTDWLAEAMSDAELVASAQDAVIRLGGVPAEIVPLVGLTDNQLLTEIDEDSTLLGDTVS